MRIYRQTVFSNRTDLNDELLDSHKGRKRAFFLGLGIPGLVGGYAGKKYANRLDSKDKSDKEIVSGATSIGALSGAGTGALLGAGTVGAAGYGLNKLGDKAVSKLKEWAGKSREKDVEELVKNISEKYGNDFKKGVKSLTRKGAIIAGLGAAGLGALGGGIGARVNTKDRLKKRRILDEKLENARQEKKFSEIKNNSNDNQSSYIPGIIATAGGIGAGLYGHLQGNKVQERSQNKIRELGTTNQRKLDELSKLKSKEAGGLDERWSDYYEREKKSINKKYQDLENKIYDNYKKAEGDKKTLERHRNLDLDFNEKHWKDEIEELKEKRTRGLTKEADEITNKYKKLSDEAHNAYNTQVKEVQEKAAKKAKQLKWVRNGGIALGALGLGAAGIAAYRNNRQQNK